MPALGDGNEVGLLVGLGVVTRELGEVTASGVVGLRASDEAGVGVGVLGAQPDTARSVARSAVIKRCGRIVDRPDATTAVSHRRSGLPNG